MSLSHEITSGDDAPVYFAFGENDLGLAVLAGSARGVRFISHADDRATLTRRVRDHMPSAVLDADNGQLNHWLAELAGYIHDPVDALAFPLDARGTEFQQSVWRVLRSIPIGQTLTYSVVAERAGRPTAVRAAASACGANPISVAIPCHRVVRRDGGLGGYACGIERKRVLLDREARRSGTADDSFNFVGVEPHGHLVAINHAQVMANCPAT